MGTPEFGLFLFTALVLAAFAVALVVRAVRARRSHRAERQSAGAEACQRISQMDDQRKQGFLFEEKHEAKKQASARGR